MNQQSETAQNKNHFDLDSLLVPVASKLPSNFAYLAHLNAVAEDDTLIRLASNENMQPPSLYVREAMIRAYENANLYPLPINPLRQRLAELHDVDVESIVISAGGTEVIDAALRTFISPGDEVVLPTPSWAQYRSRLATLEAKIIEIPLSTSDYAYHYETDNMLAAISLRTKMVIVCTPNNPTGNLMAEADIRRLADTGCMVLLDQAYCDFVEDGDFTSLIQEYENIIVAFTFSKAYSLAGLRLGYMVGASHVMDYVDLFLVPGSSVSQPALYAGLAALEDKPYHYEQVNRIITERERLIETTRALGLRAFDSHGNFFAIDVADFKGRPERFAAEILKHGVAIRVMSGIVRISVGLPEQNDVLIAAMKAVLF